MYFGQKPEEHGFSIKNAVWIIKTMPCEKHVLRKKVDFKIEFLTKFLDDSVWLCVEKFKKHSFETKQFKE